jgi:hypothetical protein
MKFGKVPLLIGLIGHRELSPIEEPKLQMIFDEYIEMYLTKYENSQIVVLSSLAEGADRLVFSSRYRPKIKIIAVLPFSVDEYRKDFKSTEERKNFEAVLSDCDDVVILEGELRNEELADLEGRSRGYAQAGA